MNTSVDTFEPLLLDAFRSYQESHLGAKRDERNESNSDYLQTTAVERVEAALKAWDDFHLQLQSKGTQPDFEAYLQHDQYKSYKIIQEFLDGCWHDEADPREGMRRSARDYGTTPTTDKDGGSTFAEAVHCLVLFEMSIEMSNRSSSQNFQLIITHFRSDAVRHASVQKLAYSCLFSCRQASNLPSQTQKSNHSGYLLSRSKGTHLDDTRLPYHLWDRTQRRTVVVHELPVRPQYMCISHTWGRWVSEGSVRLQGVPWPVPCNSRFEVSQLASILANADLPTQYVWFDLVCIPQGVYDPKRQAKEIAKQADIFANAVACVAWLNDVTTWDRLLPAIKWMGLSYAHLHSGLSFPDAELYLQDIDASDSSDIFHKVDFPLNQASGDRRLAVEPVWEPVEQKVAIHTKICCSRSLEQCPTGRRLCATRSLVSSGREISWLYGIPDWFSSLWTLQEACLCPGMSLASRSFTPLQVGLGVHVTLGYLVELVNLVDVSATRAAQTVKLCFGRRFSASNPINVMLEGNERECSGQRAPAIMSILGVTSWYEKQIISDHQTPGEGQLIWDKYPLDFVREAAAKVGPLFFATCPVDCTRRSTGAMLPFYQGEDTDASFPFGYPRIRQDAHYEPWQILPSGAVFIQNAVVLAAGSSTEKNAGQQPRDDRRKIRATVRGLPAYQNREIDLLELLEVIPTEIDTGASHSFAVHLAQDGRGQMGIILAGSVSKESHGIMILRKLGAFSIPHSREQLDHIYMYDKLLPLPKAQAVNWFAI